MRGQWRGTITCVGEWHLAKIPMTTSPPILRKIVTMVRE